MENIVVYIGQFIGFIGLAVNALSYQQKTQKAIVLHQLACSVLFAIHFFMLGAYVGCLLNFIGIFRAFIFSNKDKVWAQSKAWLYLIIAAFAAAGIVTLDGDLNIFTWNVSFTSISTYISVLPIIGMTFTTVAFWVTNPATVRRLSFPNSPCWLIYNLYNHSWAGAVTEMIVMTSIIIAMIRYDFKKADV